MPAITADDIVAVADRQAAKGLVFGSLLGLTVWAPVIGYFFS